LVLEGSAVAIPEFWDDGWLPEGHWPATWEEIEARFGDQDGGRRALLTSKLLALRDGLRSAGVTGRMILDGSYVSAKSEPGDFDVLVVGPADLQVRKDTEPDVAALLDTEIAEKELGYSLFYMPLDSPILSLLSTLWDVSKQGIQKGVVEVEI
jgi:hypothetical protein